MSEYQYLDFIAVDNEVSEKNLDYMHKQSTRASISRRRFTNEYHFGDFHGNAEEMLRRGYDVHLHFANFGIRKLMFRMPRGLPCDKRVFGKFAIRYCMTWKQDKRGTGGILTIVPEADAGTYDYLDDVESLLERLLPLRDMMLTGDLRPLFLAWLACCQDDDAKVPPIPAGLGDLTEPLEALAEFYEIPDGLIEAVASHSLPAPKKVDTKKLVRDWAAKQSKAELIQAVTGILANDYQRARSDLLAEITGARHTPWPVTNANTSFAELRSEAGL